MVSENPQLFAELILGLWSKDALIRMRAADGAERVTRRKPELLAPYRKELLCLLGETKKQRVALALSRHGSPARVELQRNDNVRCLC